MGKKKLVFDIAITGHHSEYIGHLVDYLSKEELGETEYFFVVHPEFAKTFPKIYEKAKRTQNLYWQPIKSEELNKVKNASMVRSSFIEFNIMNGYALENEVNHACLLNFHTIKYAGIFVRPSYTMNSISFLQFHRMQRKTTMQHLEFYKRYFITKWCCRNSKLETIFILNDQETVDFMNKEFDTTSFKMLPDPIAIIEPLQDFDIFTHYKIEPNRKIFLHIGSLGLRKGTDEVIEAAGHLTPADQERVAILLVGEANVPSEQKIFVENIETVKQTTKVQIIWDNKFVPINMMKSLFDQCDVVLLPYKNAEFSSGILGHAAAANKKVIATGAGLIKELVLQYGLGVLLDRPDATNVAQEISNLLDAPPISNGQMDFVKLHSPELFAKMVLND